MKEILTSFQSNIVHTGTIVGLCVAGYFLFSFIFKKHIEEKRRRDKILSRIKYLFYVLGLLFIFQIWVQGFFEILAFIGFLSAGITITQKDNLMNLVGWLIITWRGLFIEGDLIKISNYTGVVKSIGVLYFTVQETDEFQINEFTGRVIKVPNGYASKHALINYTAEKTHRTVLLFTFSKETEMTTLSRALEALTEEIKQHLRTKYDYHENLISKIYIQPALSVKQIKPIGIEARLICYSPILVIKAMTDFIQLRMFDYMKGENGIALAVD